MATTYKRQFYPGTSVPAKNRRRYMDPKVKLKKLRDVSMDDVVRIMGHRNPGEDYKSIHPPIEEGKEPDCPIRKLVEPIEGAKHGDRVRYIQVHPVHRLRLLRPHLALPEGLDVPLQVQGSRHRNSLRKADHRGP